MPSFAPQDSSYWKLWLTWVLATASVATLGLVVPDALVLGLPASDFNGDNAVLPLVRWSCGLAFIVAPLVAIAQALVLKHSTGMRILQAWVIFTCLGVVAAMIVNVLVNIVAFVGAGLLLPGVVIGFAQWLALRPHLERGSWWVLGCTIGWNAGLMVTWAVSAMFFPSGWLTFPFYPVESAAYWAITWFSGVVTFAAITGLTMVWLLRAQIESNPKSIRGYQA